MGGWDWEGWGAKNAARVRCPDPDPTPEPGCLPLSLFCFLLGFDDATAAVGGSVDLRFRGGTRFVSGSPLLSEGEGVGVGNREIAPVVVVKNGRDSEVESGS